MSYERQRTVKDGQEVILENDPDERCPTKGELDFGVDGDNNARPVKVNHHGEKRVFDEDAVELLEKILKELRIMNTYNAMIFGNDIRDDDFTDLED